MFGSQRYPEGRYAPEKGHEHNWYVWCHTGAMQVLASGEYAEWLAEHPGETYTISFANDAAARIKPGDPLWEELRRAAEHFLVEVFPLTMKGPYTSWSGDDESLNQFDAIAIRAKPESSNEAIPAVTAPAIAGAKLFLNFLLNYHGIVTS